MKKAELYAMRRNLREVDQIKDTIAKLENMRISPRAVVYGGEHVQTSPSGDVQPENIQNIDEQLRKYNAKLKAILAPMQDFERIITEKLIEHERRIMRAYFIFGKTWESICVDENKSWTWIMKLRKDCLVKICEDVEPDGAITVTRYVRGMGETKKTIRPGDEDYSKYAAKLGKAAPPEGPSGPSKDEC